MCIADLTIESVHTCWFSHREYMIETIVCCSSSQIIDIPRQHLLAHHDASAAELKLARRSVVIELCRSGRSGWSGFGLSRNEGVSDHAHK